MQIMAQNYKKNKKTSNSMKNNFTIDDARTYLPNICPNFSIYILQFIKVVYFTAIIFDTMFSYDYIKEVKSNSL